MSDSIAKGQRPLDWASIRYWIDLDGPLPRWRLEMAGIEPALVFAAQDGVTGDPLTGIEDLDLFGMYLAPRPSPTASNP